MKWESFDNAVDAAHHYALSSPGETVYVVSLDDKTGHTVCFADAFTSQVKATIELILWFDTEKHKFFYKER